MWNSKITEGVKVKKKSLTYCMLDFKQIKWFTTVTVYLKNFNVLFEGERGVGKTSIIHKTFEKAGLRVKYFSAPSYCDCLYFSISFRFKRWI